MARRTVTVNLQARKADKFLTLCNDVVEYNNTLGTLSPLADGSIVDMTAFADLSTRASDKRKKALKYYALAEAAMNESRVLIGTGSGQTVNTPGTLFTRLPKSKNCCWC